MRACGNLPSRERNSLPRMPRAMLTRMGASWRPSDSDPGLIGFVSAGIDRRFDEACRRLDVTAVSATNGGYAGRTRGAEVVASDGSRFWLKVLGVTSADNVHRVAEIASDRLRGLPKPALVRQADWLDEGVYWTARLTTLCDPAVELNPWAGAQAGRVSDAWIRALKSALDRLAAQSASRVFVSPQALGRWLLAHYGIAHEFKLSDWRLCHNDLQWSNLTAPRLSLLDWERAALSPAGYDAGMLIAYSCANRDLVGRLAREFASEFAGPAGFAARVFAAHSVRDSVREGWLDPALAPHLDAMIASLEAPLRAIFRTGERPLRQRHQLRRKPREQLLGLLQNRFELLLDRQPHRDPRGHDARDERNSAAPRVARGLLGKTVE